MARDRDETAEVDPTEVLKAMLRISPEDAEAVRERTPATRKRGGKGQGGPTADYGSDRPDKRN